MLAKLKSEGLFSKVNAKPEPSDQQQLSKHSELLTESIESPSFINSPKLAKSDDGATSSTTQSIKSTAVGTHFASSHQMSSTVKLTESGFRALQSNNKLGLSTIDEHPACFPQVEMANEKELETNHKAISAIRNNGQ